MKHGNSFVEKISRIPKSGFPHMGIYLVDSAVGFHSTFSLDIVIYKVESAAYLLNNRGLFVVAIFIVVCARIVLNF